MCWTATFWRMSQLIWEVRLCKGVLEGNFLEDVSANLGCCRNRVRTSNRAGVTDSMVKLMYVLKNIDRGKGLAMLRV